jgi:hypothetical protein
VTYTSDGRGAEGILYSVHERPDGRFPHPPGARADIYMSGRLTPDGRSATGTVWFVADTPAGRCESGPVRFSAQR